MKKKSPGPLITILVLVVLSLMLVFGHWQANLQEKRLDAIQETIIENSQTSNAVVNFINASLAGVQQ